jgi:hypothetical protein
MLRSSLNARLRFVEETLNMSHDDDRVVIWVETLTPPPARVDQAACTYFTRESDHVTRVFGRRDDETHDQFHYRVSGELRRSGSFSQNAFIVVEQLAAGG